MISESTQRKSLLEAAETEFQFLEARGLSVDVDERGDKTVVACVGRPLSFEVELDWLEGAAFLLVGHSADGHRPMGYYVDDARRVRVHLIEALRKASLLTPAREKGLKEVMHGSGEDAMSRQLAALSTELRENLEALISKADSLFS